MTIIIVISPSLGQLTTAKALTRRDDLVGVSRAASIGESWARRLGLQAELGGILRRTGL